jgi:hypothetical protein
MLQQRQARDILEIFPVQGPEARTVNQSTSGDRQIDLPATRPPNLRVELGRESRLVDTEWNRRFAR